MKRKIQYQNYLLLIISSILSIFLMELFVRISFEIAGKKRLYRGDSEIGWIPKENIKYSRKVTSLQKRVYNANYSTDDHGLRFSADFKDSYKNSNPKKKLLVIGDSYTGGLYSSDDKAWFAFLDKGLNLDVFAYGIPGSGTLQQWMVYKKLKKFIKPDIVLIQACDNDIFNDSLEYSYKTITRNQAWRAPYFKSGKIYYRDEPYVKIYRFLLNRSNLFYLIDYGFMVFQSKFFNEGEVLSDRALKEALTGWGAIYTRFINEIKNDGIKEIWSVNCRSNLDPRIRIKNYEAWLNTSELNNVRTFLKPNDLIYKSFVNKKDVYVLDGGHLSDIGNKIFGESLVEEIKAENINFLKNK